MRILFVVHQFLPRHHTGTEQYVRSLACGLKSRGHQVSIFTLEPVLPLVAPGKTWAERDEKVDGIPVRVAGLHIGAQPNHELADYQNPMAVRLFRRYLDQKKFDLVHVFHLRYLGVGALNELRVLGLPVVVNLMDFWALCPRYTLLRSDGVLCDGPPDNGLGCIGCVNPVLGQLIANLGLADGLTDLYEVGATLPDLSGTPARLAKAFVGRREFIFASLTSASAVIAPSRFLRQMFEKNGVPKGVLRHIPYGVDPSRLGGLQKKWKGLTKTLDLGYVGSITQHKGLHVLIPALRAVKGDKWKLHVHGNLDTHPEYSEEVMELAANDPRIVFHGGFKPKDLGKTLQTIDLLVVPSIWYENTPFSVLEAQMMGLPILASNLGGISELVVHRKNGYLFKAASQRSLTIRLKKILADPNQLKSLDLKHRVRTLDENIDDFVELYEECSSSHLPT